MKKIIIISLLLFAFGAEAQKSVTFKFKYLPNHNYDGIMSMTVNCNVTLKGDTQIINKLKQQGISQPVILNVSVTMNGNTKTGQPDANGVFPLVMTYKMDTLNVNVGGKAIPIPSKINSGINVYGHVGADGKLKADSLGGGKMKDTSQQRISQMMNSIQNMIKFPDHPLHIGDTFTQDLPFNIPVPGNNMTTNAKVVYKLVSITNGNAYFDATQSMNMTIPIKGESMTLTGAGTGKLVYDIKNSFPVDYKSTINLNFSGKIQTLEVNGTAVMDMDYKNGIH